MVAGDEYLWFPWQLPSYWKEPRHSEDLCDSPMSGQETVKKQPPSEAMRDSLFASFYQPATILGRIIDPRETVKNGWLLTSPLVRKKVVLSPLRAEKSSKSSPLPHKERRSQTKVPPRVSRQPCRFKRGILSRSPFT